MKLVVKRNRELAPINSQNTQNENKAEIIELIVPEEYESFNKKIVFITPNETVWDVITNNKYKITNAITQYDKVNYYIWLTKEVDGESIDFRTKTKTLNFYHNVDASDEITDEEIHGVNTVVNLLEEEIEKVENLNIEATKIGDTTTVTITKKDGTTESVEINDGTDGQDGYTPQKGIDYFTQEDINEIEGDILEEVYTKAQTDSLLAEKADTTDIPDVSNFITKDVNNLTYYTLKTNTGSLIDLEINGTTYVVTLKLKNQDGNVISTDTIDLPLESVVVSGRYDNTTKKVILTLENGSEVDFSVADLVAGLQTEITSQNKLASDLIDDTNSGNKFVTTSEKNTWNAKYDKPSGGIPSTDLASNVLEDYVKNTDYATAIKGGVIKSGHNVNVNTTTGVLSASSTSYQSYQNLDDYALIGKGTLENVITGKQLINQTQLEESQEEQDELIEDLQTENARLKATLPTTTGEGQDVTLDKTAELEFIKPPLPMGNSEQEEIFYIETTIKKGFIDSEGNVRADSNLAVMTDYIPVFPNTLYNINRSISTSYTNIRFFDKNKNFLGTDSTEGIMTSDKNNNRMLANETSLSMTILNNNVAFMVFNDYSNDLNTTYTISTLSPSPDYPQEITNVTGDVEVKVQNKNLFDKQNATSKSGYIKDNNGNEISTGGFSYTTSYIKVNPNTTYTLSGKLVNNNGTARIYYYDKNKNWISKSAGFGVNVNVCTFTTPQNCEYIQFQYINEAFDIDTIQLEKNSTPTPYTPHKEQTFTFPLGNEKLMLGDYLADDGIHKNRKKIVLDGTSENKFSSFSTGANNRGAIAAFSDIKKGVDFGHNTALCTNFAYVPNVYFDSGDTEGFIVDSTGTIYVRFGSQSEINTLAKANQWLANTLPELEYELAEETIIPYTSAQQEVHNQIKQALSYEEQTNISGSSNGSNPIFSVEGYQNTKLVLKEMATAIVALGGV